MKQTAPLMNMHADNINDDSKPSEMATLQDSSSEANITIICRGGAKEECGWELYCGALHMNANSDNQSTYSPEHLFQGQQL